MNLDVLDKNDILNLVRCIYTHYPNELKNAIRGYDINLFRRIFNLDIQNVIDMSVMGYQVGSHLQNINELVYHANGQLSPNAFIVPKNITIQFSGSCFGKLKYVPESDYTHIVDSIQHTFYPASLCPDVYLDNPRGKKKAVGLQILSTNFTRYILNSELDIVKNKILGKHTEYPNSLHELITLLQDSDILKNKQIRLVLIASLNIREDIYKYQCSKLLVPRPEHIFHNSVVYKLKDGREVYKYGKWGVCPVFIMNGEKHTITYLINLKLKDKIDEYRKHCNKYERIKESDIVERYYITEGEQPENPIEIYEHFNFNVLLTYLNNRGKSDQFMDILNQQPVLLEYPMPCVLLILDDARKSGNFEKTLNEYIHNEKHLSDYLFQFL